MFITFNFDEMQPTCTKMCRLWGMCEVFKRKTKLTHAQINKNGSIMPATVV